MIKAFMKWFAGRPGLPAMADQAMGPSESAAQLRERMHACFTRCEELQAAADARDDKTMTDEESQEFDQKMEEADRLGKEVQRREGYATLRANMKQGTGRKTQPSVPHSHQTVTEGDMKTRAEQDPKWAGFKGAADFGYAVAQSCRPGNRVDQRLLEVSEAYGISAAGPTSPQRESVGEDGGYLVPPQLRDQIWELVFDEPSIANMTDVEPTASNAVELQADESTPWGSSGIQAYWVGELEELTRSKSHTEPRVTRMKKLGVLVEASEELLEDAPRLESRLTRKSGEAIRWKRDKAIVRGDGVNQPLGFYESGALVTVAKDSSQTADTISLTNLGGMLSRLMIVDGDTPVWLANRETLPQLMDLQIGNYPAFLPSNQGAVVPLATGQLFGYPLVFTEHADELGNKGDIMLTSLRGYHSIVKEGGIRAAKSIHLWFDWDAVAFRWTLRIGGQPYLSAPVDPEHGSSTRSHFVTLAARD